jgi:hypothetical protein
MKKIFLFVFLLFTSTVSFSQESLIDSLLDNWHLAAAKSDFKKYFDFMNDDFVFLGTDPSERWTKDSFAIFCKPYFNQGKGWNFTKINRNITFSKNGKIAWFDETINTWMNVCRGSGVLIKHKKTWKISQYNLTVLIENEKMKDFLQLRSK